MNPFKYFFRGVALGWVIFALLLLLVRWIVE